MNAGKTATARTAPAVWLALALGVALLVASFARIVGDTQSILFHTNVLDSAFAGHVLGTRLASNIAVFAVALIALHLAYGLICLGLARVSQIAWPSSEVRLAHRVFLVFIVLTVWLLASNAEHFPRSSLGNPYANAMHASWLGYSPAAWLGLAVAVVAAAMSAAALRKWLQSRSGGALRGSAVASVVVIAVAAAFAVPSSRASRQQPVQGKPNVVLIGIDSLRHDLVAPESSPHIMPNLKAFLAQSVSFSNAATPLARTFPSWVSILSGREPHVTGAVVNLLPRSLVHEGTTLPAELRQRGYHTLYAIDDVRFSNIDATYGFDTTITPPIGASEFVIGFFADTPLSNLVVNTRLGRWLFPFVSANRADATVYDPDSFVDRIAREADFRQPSFIAIHLTLPHWPYVWADAPPSKTLEEQASARWPDYYLDAAQRADKQFADVVSLLRARGVLDNAIVVVLSDHGETFGEPQDSLVPNEDSDIVELNARPTWGHGTSVLTPEQYRVVLALRTFGRTTLPAAPGRIIDAPVSVEDIAPTLYAALSLPARESFSGRSLMPLLREQPGSDPFSGRIRFTETEYNPGAVATMAGKLSASAIAEAANSYRVDPVTDRVEVKKDLVGKLLRERQYAAFGADYLMAAIPSPDGSGYRYFLVNQRGGGPAQPLAGAPGTQAPAEVQDLWKALQQEFSTVLQPQPPAALLPEGPEGTDPASQKVTRNVTVRQRLRSSSRAQASFSF